MKTLIAIIVEVILCNFIDAQKAYYSANGDSLKNPPQIHNLVAFQFPNKVYQKNCCRSDCRPKSKKGKNRCKSISEGGGIKRVPLRKNSVETNGSIFTHMKPHEDTQKYSTDYRNDYDLLKGEKDDISLRGVSNLFTSML